MQRDRTRRHESQLQLFCPPPQGPTWETLASELRQELLPLLARMLVGYRKELLQGRSEKEATDE